MRLRRFSPFLIVALASGCAMNARGLANSEVDETFTSTRQSGEVASCINNALNWQHTLVQEPDGRYVIVRSHNMYGVPTVRWDIIPTPSGTRIELRSSLGMFKGTEKVRECL
jgi:hypothetical protein